MTRAPEPVSAAAGGLRFSSPDEIAQRLDRLPIGPFHRRLVAAIGLGLLVDGFDVYLASGVAGALVKQGVAELSDIAQLNAMTFLGLGIGGFFAGVLADRHGRRTALRWTLAIVIVGSLSSALAQSVSQLTALRFFTALGLGGETVLGYAMLAEFLPPSARGRWAAVLGLIANFGMPLALFLGFFLLPHDDGWRWMLVIPGLAAFLVLYLRRQLPESPRWLAAQGRIHEASRILGQVESRAAGAYRPLEVAPQPNQAGGESAPWSTPGQSASNSSAESPFRAIFARQNRRRLLVGASINVGIMSAIFGFVSWLPTFFAAAGHDIASSVLFAAIMSIGSPLGVFLGLMITERIERRWGIVVFSLLAALIGAGYVLADTPAIIVAMGLVIVTTIYLTGTLGMTGYVPELFPTRQRMRCVGLCTTVGRVVGIALPFGVVPVFSAFGQGGVVAMIALILLAQALVVGVLGLSTNNRPLESI